MIQKIAQIKEEKKFEGIVQYGLLYEEKGILHYKKSLEMLKSLIKEYPNCLEEEVVTDILNQAKEKGRRANKIPNSYAHYQDAYSMDGIQEKVYVKIGAFHVNPQSVIDLRNVPIRIYKYGINGHYVNRIIVDLNYDRTDDELECFGISQTEPWSNLKTFVMTSEQIRLSGMNPMKLKSIIKEN